MSLAHAPKYKSRLVAQKFNNRAYHEHQKYYIEFHHMSMSCYVDIFHIIPHNHQQYTKNKV